jgi:hypothetical protein
MEGFYLALGVTFALPFLQWAVPTMPRIVAYAGAAGGILVMLAEFLDPAMKPPFTVVILFLVGTLCIGGAAHLYLQFLKTSKAPPSSDSGNKSVEPAPEHEKPGSTLVRIMGGAGTFSGNTIRIGRASGFDKALQIDPGANITNNNFEIGELNTEKRPRVLASPWGEPLKAQILREVPRDKVIFVSSLLNDGESYNLATEINAFLKSNGFNLKDGGVRQSVFNGLPSGIIVQLETNDELQVIVGANR